MEVIVVNLKPGYASISIAIYEIAHLLNEEAADIAARYPEKAKSLVDSLYLPFDLVEYLKGGARNRVPDDGGAAVYMVEELVTMVLKYDIHLAKFYAKVGIKDVVIMMPPYFGQVERRCLLLEGQLADINMLSLINEHSGITRQYGIDKDFSNESCQVIFYNMGVHVIYAMLMYFSAYIAMEFKKTISVNQFQVRYQIVLFLVARDSTPNFSVVARE
ncbi:hypothetical protein ACLOJK_023309 [Asimina triloba]